MTKKVFDTNIGSFKEFKSYVSKYGLSISNFYDVHFEMSNSSGNLNNIFTRIPGGNSVNATDRFNMKGLMRFYAEECSIPGFQISTGEYRINNTPQLKYAYGIVNNEITFSFLGDANADIRKTFDAWQSYIYAHNIPGNYDPSVGRLNTNTREYLGRTRYRDDYTTDIIVVKFEKAGVYDITNKPITGPLARSQYIPIKDILPDYKPTNTEEIASKFRRAIPLYSVRLINAFPTNISSMPLSSGASDIIKVQVTFEYETAVTNAHNNGSVTGKIETIV